MWKGRNYIIIIYCKLYNYILHMHVSTLQVEGAQVVVEFPSCPSGAKAVSVRYCWRTDPCTAMKCPVYSDNLPSPPFMMDLM